MANDEKALDLYFASFLDDEEGDEEYLPVEDWKQVYLYVYTYRMLYAHRKRWGWTWRSIHVTCARINRT